MKQQILRLVSILWCLGGHPLAPASASDGDTFTTLSSPCLNVSTAVWTAAVTMATGKQPIRSLQDCLWASRQVPLQSIGLVQLDRRSFSCSLYRYRDVCHLVNLTSAATGGSQHCDTLVDSEYDAVTANAHFAAVWIGGKGPALENLVCGGSSPRNPVWSSGVVWTSDGAQMDGVSSRLWVNDSTGLNFGSAFTMLMEVKRQPRSQAFFDLTDCNTFTTIYAHFWEFPSAKQLYLYPYSNNVIKTVHTVLPSDPNESVKIGVSHDTAFNRTKFFVNSDIFSDQMLHISTASPSGATQNCLKIGYRSITEGQLNGTVRMAAVANGCLSDDVIRKFLAVR